MAAAATKVMTEQKISSNHSNNTKPEPGASWKDKLDLPEKDRRQKTAVSVQVLHILSIISGESP